MLSPLVLDLETVVHPAVPDDKPRGERYTQEWPHLSAPPLMGTAEWNDQIRLVRDTSGDFPSLARWKIVSCGLFTFSGGFENATVLPDVSDWTPGQPERHAIRRVFALLDEGRTLVTWNGRRFDVPLLCLRALALGVPLPSWYQRAGARHRYRHDAHLDVKDYLADMGASGAIGSLGQIATLIGLPGKMGTDGSSVAKMVSEGRLDEVHRYCLSDVAQTSLIERRVGYLCGRLSLAEMREDVEAILGHVDADSRLSELREAIDRDRLLLR